MVFGIRQAVLTFALTFATALSACGGDLAGSPTTELEVNGEDIEATVEQPISVGDAGNVRFKPIAGMGFLCGLANNKPVVFVVSGPDGGDCTVNAHTEECQMVDGTCSCKYKIDTYSGDCTENGSADSMRY